MLENNNFSGDTAICILFDNINIIIKIILPGYSFSFLILFSRILFSSKHLCQKIWHHKIVGATTTLNRNIIEATNEVWSTWLIPISSELVVVPFRGVDPSSIVGGGTQIVWNWNVEPLYTQAPLRLAVRYDRRSLMGPLQTPLPWLRLAKWVGKQYMRT